jgi:AhpC/TSA family
MARRHGEFLERGGRVFGLSADTVPMNTAMVAKLALPFPILSDPDRSEAITPLGFADEGDPRQISRPGTVMIDPDGEVVFSVTGRDYADRPDEDVLLHRLADLGLGPVTQDAPDLGEAEAGPTAMAYEGLPFYFRGAKFAAMALRGRHRDLGDTFLDDTRAYLRMVERYLEALPFVEERRA